MTRSYTTATEYDLMLARIAPVETFEQLMTRLGYRHVGGGTWVHKSFDEKGSK